MVLRNRFVGFASFSCHFSLVSAGLIYIVIAFC